MTYRNALLRSFKAVIALALAAGLASTAHANSRFKVYNTLGASIKVYVYNGDDTACDSVLKTITVKSRTEKSTGCAGGGNNQCKIGVQRKDERQVICKNLTNTCDSGAIKIPNKATLTVDKYANCAITEAQ